MALFANLPEDIVFIIATSLARKDLSALSRTCKAIRAHVIPYLYHSLVWSFGSQPSFLDLPCFSPWCDPSGHKRTQAPLHLLLRTLVTNRSLGALVNTFTVAGPIRFRCAQCSVRNYDYALRERNLYPASLWPPDEEGRHIGSEEMLVFEKLAEELEASMGIEGTLALRQAVRSGNPTAYTILIISMLPNLRTLRLGFDYHSRMDGLGHLFRHMLFNHSTESGSCVSTIHRVALSTSRHHEQLRHESALGLDMDTITNLLYLPDIKEIEASLPPVPALGLQWPSPHGQPPIALSLTSLRLWQCEGDVKTLKNILQATPNLRHLTYGHIWYKNGVIHPLDLCDFLHALTYVSGTLQELYIRSRTRKHGWKVDSSVWYELGHAPKGRIESLEEFVHLRKLCIPWVFLVGFEVKSPAEVTFRLPLSIESVCFTDDPDKFADWEWDDGRACAEHIHQLLQNKAQKTPRLKRIHYLIKFALWSCYPSGDIIIQEATEELERAGVYADVEVEVEHKIGSVTMNAPHHCDTWA